MAKQKKVSVFKEVIGLIPQSLKENDTSLIKRGRQNLQSQNLEKTKKNTHSTSRSLKNTKKEDNVDVALHADMLRTAFSILEEIGMCQRGSTVRNKEKYFLMVFSSNKWNDDFSLKAKK